MGAVVVAVALATGCTPEPAPSPTPTGFASDAEAFAAAEATYRAYIDAVNARRDDASSLPAPSDFLTGDAFSDEIETDQLLEDRGWHIVGHTTVSSVIPDSRSGADIMMSFCLDASDTAVRDVDDNDVTPTDRAQVLGVDVTITAVGSALLIASSSTSAMPC